MPHTIESSLFNLNTKKEYSYQEITDLLKNIECPVNKFLTNVRKVMKLKSSCPLWYGFSDELLSKYDKLKNKDKYARIEGEFQLTRSGERYNFKCIPIARSYYIYHCLEIEVIDGIVKVINAYEQGV